MKASKKSIKAQVKPVNEYTSKCCNAPANKPPCIKTEDKDCPLGTWNCTHCGRSCTVSRSKIKEE